MLLISRKRKKWLDRIDRLGYALRFFRPRPLPRPEEVGRILVLELWGIGDVVLATTVLQGLRERYPNAQIALLAQECSREILKNCPWPDEFVTFRFPWTANENKYQFWKYPWGRLFRLFAGLRKGKFDLAVDGRMDIRNNVILWLSGARHRVGFPDGGGGFLLTHLLARDTGREHRVEEWRQLLTGLGAEGGKYEPRLCVAPEERAEVSRLLEDFRKNSLLIGLHPGAAHPIRRWPTEKFIAAVEQVNRKAEVRWLIFGEDGLVAADQIQQAVPRSLRFRGNVQRFLAGMENCDLILCNDSGPMHMAAALGKPVTAVFGPGSIQWFGPWGSRHHLIFVPNVPCRPCYDRCSKDAPICMDSITAEEVAGVILKQIPPRFRKDG